jgi:hypothetical protein
MKLWSVIGLLFTAAILATMPVSPQVTQRGVELSVSEAQAITYGRARRVTRRAYRRSGYAAPGYGAVGATYGGAGYGYGDAGYGYGGASYGYGGAGYGYGAAGSAYAGAGGYGAAGYPVVAAGPGRWCTIYPGDFRWCWTQY